MDLVVELGCVVDVAREVEDEVLGRVTCLEELPHLVEVVGMVIVLVGERHGYTWSGGRRCNAESLLVMYHHSSHAASL